MNARHRSRAPGLVAALTALTLAGLAPLPAGAASTEVLDRSALRVCADPANLPFSNKAREGFENKIADLIAAELGVPVLYTWFPQATGFVRNTLRARKCDLVIGISLGFELLQNTNPYYRSAYALVYRADSGITATALDDPELKGKSFGVVAGTPPASLLAKYRLLDNLRPYQLMVDTRFDKPGKQMIADIAAGEVDVGVLWGPIAGYYAQQHNPPVKVVPLKTRDGEVRLDYRITMGIRFNEPDWKHQLNDLIKRKQPEINAILHDYGVPLLDDKGEVIPSPGPKQKAEAVTAPEPEGYRMERYRAPVPATLAGGTVVGTEQAKAMAEGGEAILIDVMFRPPKPKGLKEGTVWRPRPRSNIPGSVWLANTGYGALSEDVEAYFSENLKRLTGGDKGRALLFYCKASCWMSWNAAKRAISYGYSKVHWYPEGTDGWAAAGWPLAAGEPEPIALTQ